jgi:hypothetical protein
MLRGKRFFWLLRESITISILFIYNVMCQHVIIGSAVFIPIYRKLTYLFIRIGIVNYTVCIIQVSDADYDIKGL